MALCGLWHGASWTFVLWGTLHGCALVIVLAVAPLWPAHAVAARMGADGDVRAADRRDLPRRLDGGRVAYLSGARGPAGFGASAARAPIIVGALCAFLLPASQDIVAWLTRAAEDRDRRGARLSAWSLLLVELGDRDAYEFVYFQF